MAENTTIVHDVLSVSDGNSDRDFDSSGFNSSGFSGSGFSGSGYSGSGFDENERKNVVHITLQSLSYFIIFVLGIIGNTLVCAVLARRGKRRPVSAYFLWNLALADLGVLLIYMPFYMAYDMMNLIWPFGSFLCKAIFSSTYVFLYSSLGTLVAISIERYMLTFRTRMCKDQAVRVICGIWVVAFLAATPQMKLHEVVLVDEEEDLYSCEVINPSEFYQKIAQIIDFIILYFVPLLFTAFLYTKIIRRLRKASKSCFFISTSNAQNKKAVRLLVTVVCVFAICLLPLHALQMLRVFNPDVWEDLLLEYPWFFSFCIGLYLFTHAINPLIYGALSSSFRARVNDVFHHYVCRGKGLN